MVFPNQRVIRKSFRCLEDLYIKANNKIEIFYSFKKESTFIAAVDMQCQLQSVLQHSYSPKGTQFLYSEVFGART